MYQNSGEIHSLPSREQESTFNSIHKLEIYGLLSHAPPKTVRNGALFQTPHFSRIIIPSCPLMRVRIQIRNRNGAFPFFLPNFVVNPG